MYMCGLVFTSLEGKYGHLWEFPDGVSQCVAPPGREDGGGEGDGDGADGAARLGRRQGGQAKHLLPVQPVTPEKHGNHKREPIRLFE